MAESAYVLVEVAPPAARREALEEIRNIVGVKRADTVTGPYDIIVYLEAGGIGELEHLFTAIRKVKQVGRLTTCFAFEK